MSLWKAYLEEQPWLDRRCLHMIRKELNGTHGVVQPLTLKTFKDGQCHPENDGLLGDYDYQETNDFLQAIMDTAWGVGIRPIAFQDHTNELTAVRFHLEDMRLLAKVRDK